MKKIIIGLFSFLLLFNAGAKENKYPINDIKPEIRDKARSVIRNYQIEFEIQDEGKAILKKSKAITVLNENGYDDARAAVYYDDLSRIKNIEAAVYDANGEQIKRIRNKDIHDVSAISGFSMYDDNRVKIIDFKMQKYPFTVEYSYEKVLKNLMFYPEWYALPAYNVGVEHTSLKVISPKNVKVRYKEYNLDSSPTIEETDEQLIYKWELTQLEPIESEPYSYGIEALSPIVKLAPSVFGVDGYYGDASSWEKIGEFVYKLNEGLDELPEETVLKMKELTSGTDDPIAKAKIVYQYLQDKTRYVSIQEGIGSWQPFGADIVDKYSYGDCKDLSNYTRTLLKSVGVDSYYALVGAGSREQFYLDAEFPTVHFNHVILALPVENDTTWLECTSQNIPFGYLGHHTDDRNVLIMNEEGGKLVRTRCYNKNDNLQSRKIEIELLEGSSCKAKVNSRYCGLNYDYKEDFYFTTGEDREKMIYNSLGLPEIYLDNYDYSLIKSEIPEIHEELNLTVRNHTTRFGNRLFLPLTFINKVKSVPEKIEDRKTPIVLRRSYVDLDTICYALPEGYEIEALPESVEIKNEFGAYSMNIEVMDSEICIIRRREYNKGIYDPEKYAGFVQFYKDMYNADKGKIALKEI